MEGSEVSVSAESIKPKRSEEAYRIGDANVNLSCVETTPKNPREFLKKRTEQEGQDPSKGVVFIGAWNWLSDFPIMTGISQKIADGFGQTVYQIDSKTNKIGPDSYNARAEAIVQFISARGLSEVTIIGHSEGGLIAANLAAALEKNNPQVQIDGVVLMDSMGMYSRNPLDLVKKFVSDPIKVAPKEFKDSGVTPPDGGGTQLLTGLWRDLKYFGLRYPKELLRQIKSMASLNPALQQVKAPVLVLTAERDYASDYRGYLPPEEIDARTKSVSPDSNYPKHDAMFNRGKARNQYLQEKVLPNAENVVMIVASKGAHHAGLTDIRMDQVAKVASRIFERMRKKAA